MAFSIPEYNERIIANPESRPQINLNLPKELSDTSHIDRMANKISNFKKEETEVLLDMKKERDNGIVNEFMNIYNTERIAKITELKEKYKGGNAQGIVDEYKKWQDDYYTSHIGFSSQNEDGTLYLENNEQVTMAKEELAKNLPSEINTLSTYAATELEDYKKNQFTARVQFAADDLSDERDLNNIALGIGNLNDMVNSFYAGESDEFKKYTAGKLANEALSVNVANMIAVGSTDEELNQAEQMLKSDVVYNNLTPKTRMELEEKLLEKRAKLLGAKTAASGEKKAKATGEALAYGDIDALPEDATNIQKAAFRQGYLEAKEKIFNTDKQHNQQLAKGALSLMSKMIDGNEVTQEDIKQTAETHQLLPDELNYLVKRAGHILQGNIDAVLAANEYFGAIQKSEEDSLITGGIKDVLLEYPEFSEIEATIMDELDDTLESKEVTNYSADNSALRAIYRERNRQQIATNALKEVQSIINNISDDVYDDISIPLVEADEISQTNPMAAKLILNTLAEKAKVDDFYLKNKSIETEVENNYAFYSGASKPNGMDYKNFRERVAKALIELPKDSGKSVTDVATEIYLQRAKGVTAYDKLSITLEKAKFVTHTKEEKEESTPAELRFKDIMDLLDNDMYDKYNLTKEAKALIAKHLLSDRVAIAETYLRSLEYDD